MIVFKAWDHLLKSACVLLLNLVISVTGLRGQDLDPRAYLWVPIRANTMVTGLSFLEGAVLTDPTIPIENIHVSAQTPSIGLVHSFGFLGKTSQLLVAAPYTWAHVTGDVNGQQEESYRSGLGDLRLRWSVLFFGAPATLPEAFKSVEQKTILGFSINVQTPTGQYFPDKLVNISTHRWSIRPELALSQPVGHRWLIDVYAGLWLFTTNPEFYPGDIEKKQDPMGAFQAHVSYNIKARLWVALNTTYYAGGTTVIDGTYNDDRQSNTRVGLTSVMPIGKKGAIKLSVSTGAVVRVGQDFTNVSIGYQTSWFSQSKD